MELLNANFNADYFSFLLSVVSACVCAGVLIPFAFWAVGSVVGAFFSWVRGVV